MGRMRACWALGLALAIGACSGSTKRRAPDDSSASGGQGPGSGALPTAGIQQVRQAAVDKVDLLLVVDNSLSMGDKQELLADAMPYLIKRLTTPRCVRRCVPSDNCTPAQEQGRIPVGGDADSTGLCANGEPDLTPVRDLHVGVITSSLGSHGASAPTDVCVGAGGDEHARLLGQLRGLPGTWNETGFLAWDAMARKSPPGDADPGAFVDKASQMIRAAGEHGCGYESTLEAWYRFLVDPEPPSSVVVKDGKSVPQGIDETVLSQRAQFLRPDSAVAIVMLTDENDCSIVDEGYGYMVATARMPMFRSTSACGVDPNDACCQSCGEAAAEAGCPDLASDSECQKGVTLATTEDDLNLRCWDQKRRFGMDLLYPTRRYVDALKSPVVTLRSGQVVANPLLQPGEGGMARDPGLVLLAGIVGVPWQDLADEESLVGPGLRYLSAPDLETLGRWDVVLGQPDASPPAVPLDPLMQETTSERTGSHPLTNSPLVSATSTNPFANPINGHEQRDVGARDLQYACIFPLAEPRVCDLADDRGCDCYAEDAPLNRPLCQPPGGGAAGTTQYFAKAYPGLRSLAVLKEVGANAVVASICPKVLDKSRADYGYNPAMDALVNGIGGMLKGRCLPRELPVRDDGTVPCAVVQAAAPGESCDCFGSGLGEVTTALDAAVRRELERNFVCGDEVGLDCASACLCEIPQLEGSELASCQNDPVAPNTPGFCYVNATPDEAAVGNPALVSSCSDDQQRLLRFVGGAPSKGATVWLSCVTP